MGSIIPLDAHGQWSELWEVQSQSRAGVAYVVARKKDGSFACSCPAWIFHTPRKDCKHIASVRRWIAQPIKAPAVGKPILTGEKLQKVLNRFALVE